MEQSRHPPAEEEFLLHPGEGTLPLSFQISFCRLAESGIPLPDPDPQQEHIDRMHIVVPLLINKERRVLLISPQDIQKIHEVIVPAKQLLVAVQKCLIDLPCRLFIVPFGKSLQGLLHVNAIAVAVFFVFLHLKRPEELADRCFHLLPPSSNY